jgi:hypothetical protein
MGITSIELFRSGNSSSCLLERVRIQGANPDVDVYNKGSGSVWVRSNGLGVSTWDLIDPTWSGKPWRLPVGSAYPDCLRVWNDDPNHWVWEPFIDMPLSDYVAALQDASSRFLKV